MSQGNQDHRDLTVAKETVGNLVIPDLKEKPDQEVSLDLSEILEHQVEMDPLDHPDPPETTG